MPDIELLRQLRRVVDAAPDDLFHMRAFCETAGCGTARCAAGWAAIDPWFLANTWISQIIDVDNEGFVTSIDGFAFSKLAKLFDIPQHDTDNLVGGQLKPSHPPHAVTKRDVIANIDALIGGLETRPYFATT